MIVRNTPMLATDASQSRRGNWAVRMTKVLTMPSPVRRRRRSAAGGWRTRARTSTRPAAVRLARPRQPVPLRVRLGRANGLAPEPPEEPEVPAGLLHGDDRPTDDDRSQDRDHDALRGYHEPTSIRGRSIAGVCRWGVSMRSSMTRSLRFRTCLRSKSYESA